MDEQEEALSFEPIPLNEIQRGKKRAFLRAFAETGIIAHACNAAGIDRTSVFHWRKEDEAFARVFKQARRHASELLEVETLRRAKEGVVEPVIYQGQLVLIPSDLSNPDSPKVPLLRHTYSDVLAMFLLKGARPRKYRERTENENKNTNDNTNREAESNPIPAWLDEVTGTHGPDDPQAG